MSDRVRGLTEEEIGAYDLIDSELASAVRIVDIPLLPGRYQGITLGRWVCLAEPQPATGTSTLIAHELVHVKQWHDDGVVRFSMNYLGAFAKGLFRHKSWDKAYRAIPAEVDARTETAHWIHQRNL